MEDKTNETKTFLFHLLIRITIFLTLFLSSTILFYIIGNYQHFLDTNQRLILNIATISSIPLIFISFATFILGIIRIAKSKQKKFSKIARTIFLFAIFFYALIIMIFTRTIEFLSDGF
ncbi:MAG: hypothetical protein IKI31_00735 [Treponema sp.]|nr:hypothetical protein [Treponema sp.]